MTIGAISAQHPAVPSVRVCLLGGFRLLKHGQQLRVRPGSKTCVLLSNLALRYLPGINRDELLDLLWPATSAALAAQSLNTLVYTIHRELGDALAGRPPIVHLDGRYRLNVEGGVVVDVAEFDAAVNDGDRLSRDGRSDEAMVSYGGAAAMYTGDLVLGSEVQHVIECERLRARYLYARSRLADHHFTTGSFAMALDHALGVLAHDPCREDAHRMAMRSYVRLGERAQALRQYRLCRDALLREFDAPPERATLELFELIRLDPSVV